MLRQALVYLLSNAFKCTRDADPAGFDVAFKQMGGEGVFVVRDNGAGFEMRRPTGCSTPFRICTATTSFWAAATGAASNCAFELADVASGAVA